MAENAAAKAMSKSTLFQELATKTGLTRKQVGEVFDALGVMIKGQLAKKGPGVIKIPGLIRIKRVHKPATKARQGINPFTKEPTTFKARPARSDVKVAALKGLKEMVGK